MIFLFEQFNPTKLTTAYDVIGAKDFITNEMQLNNIIKPHTFKYSNKSAARTSWHECISKNSVYFPPRY